MTQPILVQKYGGSSLANAEAIERVADQVARRAQDGYRICVVVSAMGGTTDELIAQAKKLHAAPPRRELDMLMTVGERSSAALLAMALDARGFPAMSLTGSQAGIVTTASHAEAQILEVRPYRVMDALDSGQIVVLAGFQGVSFKKEITTLGRGGSDTTAVAMAAALSAEACEIYSDVEGVFTADPRIVSNAKKLSELSFQEMQELAASGAKVLNAQAVEFAKDKNIAIFARQTGKEGVGTEIRLNPPTGSGGVRGVSHLRQIFLAGYEAASLSEAGDFISSLHTVCRPNWVDLRREDSGCQAVAIINPENVHVSMDHVAEALGGTCRSDLGVVSLVGQGVLSTPQLLTESMRVLDEADIELVHVTSSSFRLSFVVPSDAVDDCTRLLHSRWIL